MNTINVIINDKEYNLLYAKTESEKEQGLQNVESMDDNEGCFFDYRNDIQDEISFWMKDTEIPLDIIFVNEDDEVISVQKGVPLSEDYITEKNVAYVIELNQNSGIRPGDEVDIEDEDDDLDLPENGMFILNQDGSIQFTLSGGERIFSRKATRQIIKKAKIARASKLDSDYKALGKYIFKELDAQEKREPEYVEK